MSPFNSRDCRAQKFSEANRTVQCEQSPISCSPQTNHSGDFAALRILKPISIFLIFHCFVGFYPKKNPAWLSMFYFISGFATQAKFGFIFGYIICSLAKTQAKGYLRLVCSGIVRVRHGFITKMALLDSDFDPFKQCFIDDSDVEFYGSAASPNSTTPSEDIWKKFDDMDIELQHFPTPPLSPSHPGIGSDGEDTGGGGAGGGTTILTGSFSEKLQRVSEFLDDEPAWMTQNITFLGPDTKQVAAALAANATVLRTTSPARISIGSHKSNYLIQDCMWSAIQAEERRRQMQAEKAAKTSRLSGQIVPANSGDFSSGECVDPTSVFPYPLSDTRLDFSPTTPSDSGKYIIPFFLSFFIFFFLTLYTQIVVFLVSKYNILFAHWELSK